MNCALPLLASQINEAHDAATAGLLGNVRLAGNLLIQAKRQIQHGLWLPWLAAHCPDITPRTAQGYMRVARCWSELEEKRNGISHLTLREALDLLAEEEEPEEEGEDQDWDDLGDGGNDDPGNDDAGDDDPDPKDNLTYRRFYLSDRQCSELRVMLRALVPLFQVATQTDALLAAVRHAYQCERLR